MEQIEKAIRWFENIAEECDKLTSGNVAHLRAQIKGMAIRSAEYLTKHSQEPASEDLEKFTERINTFQARYKHPEITSIKGAMAFMARMFYQYPNVAREWYESLPKATMD